MARRHTNDSGERRTVKVTVQLTPSERAELDTMAEAETGGDLSELCRRRLFVEVGSPPPSPRDVQAIRALSVALVRIGTNLNQLTRLANENRVLPAERDLREMAEEVKSALQKVTEL